MRGNFHVVLDACVLANQSVCDLLLRLAEPPRLHIPHWSLKILQEARDARTKFRKNPWPADKADYWRSEIERHFPESLVESSENLEASCTNDLKDRHVLAAAIRSSSQCIITFNLKDFPPESTAAWDIEAVHPADYLVTLYNIDSGLVVSRLNDMAARRRITTQELLARLRADFEPFTTHVADALGWSLPEP